MKPILPEEISGLIDGALDPARAAEVRSAIEHDPELKQHYQSMLAVHQDITAYAGLVTHRLQLAAPNRFRSTVPKRKFHPRGIVFAALALLLVRLFCKLASPPASIAVESIVLALVIAAASIWLLRVSDRDAAGQLG